MTDITLSEKQLSENSQAAVVRYINAAYSRGKNARAKYESHWKQCAMAYHCQRTPIESPELNWQSNLALPWAYEAAESWYAYMHTTTMPRDNQVFTLSGRTGEDHRGAQTMERYLKYCFERNDFARQFGKALRQLAIKNHTCLKIHWRQDKVVSHEWCEEISEDGNPVLRRMPVERTVFNNVWVDVVDIDHFVMDPVHGDFEKTTRIHETFRFYEDLMATAQSGMADYFNLDQLSADDERTSGSSLPPGGGGRNEVTPGGVNVKEAWIHRLKIDATVYRNVIATVVNDKTLIRFQPNPYGDGSSPFVFMALRPDEDCLYGYGLNSKGLSLLDAANQIFNARLDELKFRVHPPHKYYDDGIFNPYNVLARPGAMIELTREGVSDNLQPLPQDFSHLRQAAAEVAELKNEFESVTMPKLVKGALEMRDVTATEITQAHVNSSGRMHIDAHHINQRLLRPALERAYQLIFDRLQFDAEIFGEFVRVTQPADIAPDLAHSIPLLPLPQVDIQVVGYQNTVRKSESLAAMNQLIGTLAMTPAGKLLKWEHIARQAMRLMDQDADLLLMGAQEQAQMMQQDMMQLQAKLLEDQNEKAFRRELSQFEAESKAQLEALRLDHELYLKNRELDLRQLEVQGELQAEKSPPEKSPEENLAPENSPQENTAQDSVDSEIHETPEEYLETPSKAAEQSETS